jgi:hypothetical protein
MSGGGGAVRFSSTKLQDLFQKAYPPAMSALMTNSSKEDEFFTKFQHLQTFGKCGACEMSPGRRVGLTRWGRSKAGLFAERQEPLDRPFQAKTYRLIRATPTPSKGEK